ncbi:PRC-barrel domain-containing protein [Legionella sp. WA2022007384]
MENFNIVRTEDVKGKDVKSPELESLGEIEEIVLDKFTGEARYVVLSFGGFLGLGEKYFAFPWKSISYNPDEECFILNINKSKLKKEYGFDKDHWPDMATWPKTIDAYYDPLI